MSLVRSGLSDELDEPAAHPGPLPCSGLLDVDIRLAAHVLVPVLVTAGDCHHRDLCARLIHATSDFVRGPFVTFSATAVAGADLLQPSDRAETNRTLRHHFDHARGGTLFVDDVAVLTAEGQAALLALLE